MNRNINTLELARIYESQGHFQDALEIYTALDNREPSELTTAGLNRMKRRLDSAPHPKNETRAFDIELLDRPGSSTAEPPRLSDQARVSERLGTLMRLTLLEHQWTRATQAKQRLEKP